MVYGVELRVGGKILNIELYLFTILNLFFKSICYGFAELSLFEVLFFCDFGEILRIWRIVVFRRDGDNKGGFLLFLVEVFIVLGVYGIVGVKVRVEKNGEFYRNFKKI